MLVALLAACASLGRNEERRVGDAIARQARSELLFVRDAVVIDYVRDIGENIARVSGPHAFKFHFEVVEDDTINAFAAPAGWIYIHTGTILQARNVSELAAVLAHEIGHVALDHVTENYERQVSAGRFRQVGVLAASVFGFGGLADFGGALATMAVLNSFTRDDEREADAFALEVLPLADYDPAGMLTFLAVVRAEGGNQSASFLSTHPATRERIAEAEALLAERPPSAGLDVTDGGRLEIIQRRIELLTRKVKPPKREPSGPQPL